MESADIESRTKWGMSHEGWRRQMAQVRSPRLTHSWARGCRQAGGTVVRALKVSNKPKNINPESLNAVTKGYVIFLWHILMPSPSPIGAGRILNDRTNLFHNFTSIVRVFERSFHHREWLIRETQIPRENAHEHGEDKWKIWLGLNPAVSF